MQSTVFDTITCKQYIGETKRTLRERFTEHRQSTNNPDHANASAAVPSRFNLPDHSLADIRLIPLELQPSKNILIYKRLKVLYRTNRE